MAKMKAVQVPKAGADLELVEREIPQPDAGHVRIHVQACGICHSDVITKEGLFPGITYPRVPGDEVAGVIDELGAGVKEWLVASTRKEISMALKPRRDGSTEPQATGGSNGEERAAGAGGNSELDAEIRRRAYQLYLERGEEHGRDLDDWLQAKREFEDGARWPERAN